jgi:hypothetical protein
VASTEFCRRLRKGDPLITRIEGLECLTADPCRVLDIEHRVDGHIEERAENGSVPGEQCRIIGLYYGETARAVDSPQNCKKFVPAAGDHLPNSSRDRACISSVMFERGYQETTYFMLTSDRERADRIRPCAPPPYYASTDQAHRQWRRLRRRKL